MSAAGQWMGLDLRADLVTRELDGVTVRYLDVGDGPALLLLHGMAGSWESWLTNIPALMDGYRVVAVDMPGFGGSGPLSRDAHDFVAYARVLENLLDELGIASVALVGHSLGGLLALTFAVEFPFRVRCVLVAAGGGAALSRVRLAAIQAGFWAFRILLSLPGVARVLSDPRVGGMLLRPVVHDAGSLPAALLREMIPRTVGAGFLQAVKLGSAHVREFDPRRVAAPALLVWGSEDRILPVEYGRRLADDLQDARLLVLPDVGHCAMFEAPTEFNNAALAFFEEHRSDGPGHVAGRATARSWLFQHGRTGSGTESERDCGGV